VVNNVNKATPQQLYQKIDDLVKIINASDWKEQQQTMEAEKQRLLGCKRKLDDRLDEEFLEERQRLREERRKWQEEKDAFEGERRPTAVVAATVNDIIIIENDG
jgi:exonuclease VII large subunit